MPDSGLNSGDPTLVAAFQSALLHAWGVIVVIFIVLLLVYATARDRHVSSASAASRPILAAEPKARAVARVGLGVLWLLDGALQAQPKMPGGLPSQVIEPAAASSPHWVQHVVNVGVTMWSYHPVQAAAAAVWIQVGLGLWLIAAADGWWSRLAGMVSAAWALVVWVFGEAFGGIFSPGLTWLFGAPGAAGIYVAAGALIALPSGAWAGPRLGRLVLSGTGVFWIGMAVLQAWPGRGFWQGANGTLTAMVRSMAQTSQPHVLAAAVAAFTSFNAAHGFAVNLFAVLALTVFGAAFLVGRPGVLRIAVPAATVVCLADWVLVEDFGFLGGLGTDPNSMIPWLLLAWTGYFAITRTPCAASPETSRASAASRRIRWTRSGAGAALRPSGLGRSMAAASARSVAAVGAVGIVAIGAAPMAIASTDPNADPIIAQAIAGAPVPLNQPAPGFRLTSQSNQTVSLAGLRGKVVLLTFLDPVRDADSQIIAQELIAADTMLGPDIRRVELIAITDNPAYRGTAFTRAFDRQEGLAGVQNWLYLTGTVAELGRVSSLYAAVAHDAVAGAGSAPGDVAFVIDASGRIRRDISDNPGPGTTATRSSFAVLLADAARQTLSS